MTRCAMEAGTSSVRAWTCEVAGTTVMVVAESVVGRIVVRVISVVERAVPVVIVER